MFLATLILSTAVGLPPSPTSVVVKTSPPLSPKAGEFRASLGSSMTKAVTTPAFVLPGFSITNFSVLDGQVSLGWQPGTNLGPWQVQGTPDLVAPTWNTVASVQTTSAEFPVGDNRFWRIKATQVVPTPGTFQWVVDIRSTSGTASIYSCRAVVVDPNDGSIVTLGDYQGSSCFVLDSVGNQQTLPSSTGSGSLFLAKFTKDGVLTWIKTFSTTGQFGKATVGTSGPFALGRIAVDSNGNIVITGAFAATINFGGSLLTKVGWTTLNPQVETDIFVAAFDSVGTHLWSYNFGANGVNTSLAYPVFDSVGNVIVACSIAGTVNFGAVGGPTKTPIGSSDVVVLKLNSNSAFIWLKQFGATSQGDFPKSVVVDSADSIYLGGQFTGTLDFGNSTAPLVSASGPDIFIVKLSSLGLAQWTGRGGGPGANSLGSIAVDTGGNVAVIAAGLSPMDFNGTPVTNLTSTQVSQIAFAKYNANGTLAWAKSFDESNGQLGDTPYFVTYDGSGFVFAGVLWSGAVDFPPPTGMLSPYQADNIFALKTSQAGTFVWGVRYQSSTDRPYGIATDSTGNVIVAAVKGGPNAPIDFGGGHTMTSSPAHSDGMLFKIKGG